MGFDWFVNVSAVFSQPIAVPEDVSYLYFLKRLATFELPPEPAGKRARAAGLITVGDAGYDEFEVNRKIGRDYTAQERRFHYNPKLDDGSAEEREIELENNYTELISEAFVEVADKLFGQGHGLELRWPRGGEYGEAAEGAEERMLLLLHGASRVAPPGEGIEHGRASVAAPWGVSRCPLPWIDEATITARFDSVRAALGLQAAAPAGWALLTAADGG